jgi:hypothetical protein
VALVGVGFYLWPAVARSSARTDVVLAGDGQLSASSFSLGRRLRERGDSVDDALLVESACGSTAALARRRAELDPTLVVISYRAAPPPSCPDGGDPAAFVRGLVAAARPAGVLLVVQPGAGGQDADMVAALRAYDGAKGVTVVDPTRLLTSLADPERAACQWWDDCDLDGSVAIRDAGGALTLAGRERVARAVAAAVP